MNIYEKIINIMSRVDYLQKGDKKVNNQYRFVSHDQVTARLHGEFVAEKIVCIPSVEKTTVDGNRVEVILNTKFINAEKPEEFIEIRSIGFGIDKQDKGPGKAVSYAYKYALLKMFALETGDDPDNNVDNDHEPKPVKKTTEPEPENDPKTEAYRNFLSLINNADSLQNLDSFASEIKAENFGDVHRLALKKCYAKKRKELEHAEF